MSFSADRACHLTITVMTSLPMCHALEWVRLSVTRKTLDPSLRWSDVVINANAPRNHLCRSHQAVLTRRINTMYKKREGLPPPLFQLITVRVCNYCTLVVAVAVSSSGSPSAMVAVQLISPAAVGTKSGKSKRLRPLPTPSDTVRVSL